MIEVGDPVVWRDSGMLPAGTVEERRVRLLVRSPDGDSRWHDEKDMELAAEVEGPAISDVKVPHAEVGDKVCSVEGFEGMLTRIQSVIEPSSGRRTGRIGHVVADSVSKWLNMEALKKVERFRRFLVQTGDLVEEKRGNTTGFVGYVEVSSGSGERVFVRSESGAGRWIEREYLRLKGEPR